MRFVSVAVNKQVKGDILIEKRGERWEGVGEKKLLRRAPQWSHYDLLFNSLEVNKSDRKNCNISLDLL